MRPDDRDRRGTRHEGQGGIPDGLLIGTLAFLLGITLLVWTSAGLAALFSHGAWPTGVTFTRTPLAMRHLIGHPHDLPGAWPGAPAPRLPGWGLFWGLFIGQLMILLVVTVFVMSTIARWRAGKARRAFEREEARGRARTPAAAAPEQRYEVPAPRAEAAPAPVAPPLPAHATETDPAPRGAQILLGTAAPAPPDARPADGGPAAGLETPRAEGTVLCAPPAVRHATAAQAVQDAPGPLLVVTSDPALWARTKDARAKLGPTLLYDPTHRCDTPARLHWSPTSGCEDKPTALARATALLGPVRPTARIDQAVTDTATTLLRSYLHAAALENRTVRHVHRWAQGTQVQDAVRTLRTHPKAAPGAAGELEAALTAHPQRRDVAQELTTRALSALLTVNVREACTPDRTDALALDSFVHEGGTLYVVGESIEDPRTDPGAMPFLTALVSSAVERGRRMAERSSSGRLDPPLTLVLDDVAAVAPLPQLPDLLAAGTDRGLPTLALLRSREQARARWPHQDLPV
ncbi:type IV secretory system conjugative DNA transfer family protein [Streptomyces sp. TG1A-8]|uniref:type IV secretory system conjugative DNA transfer family protein n=1 Tax=Streptomyces sp. TG1A-8 TaxID=3051385 RepID=UPI00265C3F04|nr:type IV secretory system conjugative DNA transfer family protein [Streptomyces sp. TG1A-8]MDO0927043.1 type IV secretory system conjugative DNA transfer family protein [Streptomyces sp. TG1A-8]